MPTYTFKLNGKTVTRRRAADMPLLWVLRDKLGVTGPKYGCGVGVCRACTSHLNGQAAHICTVHHVVGDVAGKNVVTIEGLANNGTLHPVQQAWIDEDVAQCGFCQPGQIMAGRRHAQNQQAPNRRRHRRDHERLPLRHLLPHPRSDQTRRRHQLIEQPPPVRHGCHHVP